MLSVMYLGNVSNVFMRARIGDGLHIWILTPVVLNWLGINNNKSIQSKALNLYNIKKKDKCKDILKSPSPVNTVTSPWGLITIQECNNT